MRLIYIISVIMVFIFSSCNRNEEVPNGKILLNDNWEIQSIGQDSDSIFINENYLFKYKFELPKPGKEQYVTLNFNRANQSANVSLNGHQIVYKDNSDNPYGKKTYDITSQLEEQNYLEIKAFRSEWKHSSFPSTKRLGGETDENMSLIGSACLKITGRVAIEETTIRSEINTSTLDEAWLTVNTCLRNKSNQPVKGKLILKFEDRSFSVPVKLDSHEERNIELTTEEAAELYIKNPGIWWSNNMGNPEMYKMKMAFETGGKVSDSEELPFCIREINEYIASDNQRAYKLNGKNLFIKGAAWDDDLYYRSTPEIDEIQILYARDMNLNAIFFTSDRYNLRHLYELCDKYGLIALEYRSIECDTTAFVNSAPFDYVNPTYWYGDSTSVKATGFNIMAGVGTQLPVIESLIKMIPANQLNPDTLKSNLEKLTEVIEGQYGEITDLKDYLRKADLLNYDGTKAMFEAFRINSPKATGIVQWKLGSAFPSLYRQLFDYYLTPTSGYYSARKANTPQQLLYNYKSNTIYYVNDIIIPVERRAIISLYGIDSKLLHVADLKFRVEADVSKKIFDPDPIAGIVFMYLQLFDSSDNFISDNFYCLSGNMGQYDRDNFDETSITIQSYTDYKELSLLPESELDVKINTLPGEDTLIIKVKITNTNNILSYMTRLMLKDDAGNVIVPVFWDDNYVSVLPDETKEIRCRVDNSAVNGKQLCLHLSGWNLQEKVLPFPCGTVTRNP